MTLAEIADARLDVISYARDVLERAREEAGHNPPARAKSAWDDLSDALSAWEQAASGEERDEAVWMCAYQAPQLVRVIEDELGWDAAEYVSTGQEAQAA